MDIELFSIILLIHYQYFYQCFKTYVLNLKKEYYAFCFPIKNICMYNYNANSNR